MKKPVIDKSKSYTFFDYFRLNVFVEDLADSFGYSFVVSSLSLPRTKRQLDRIDDLRARLESNFRHLSFTSEAARREFLIAPVLMDLIYYTDAKIRVEYPLRVSNQLQGTLDYFIRAQKNLLVVEAKNEDLARGFTQLTAELIALDQLDDELPDILYGAVSTGSAWQFGTLERKSKGITQDFNLYSVPNDLEDLLGILVGIVSGE
jgi:hypothetical protein